MEKRGYTDNTVGSRKRVTTTKKVVVYKDMDALDEMTPQKGKDEPAEELLALFRGRILPTGRQ